MNEGTIYERLNQLLDASDSAKHDVGQRPFKMDHLIEDDYCFSHQVQWSEIARTIIQWLNHPQNNDWLLVFDNADNVEAFDIRTFFPSNPYGAILITSRDRGTARMGKGYPVGELNDIDAISLLLKSANIDHILPEGGNSPSQHNTLFSFDVG